MWADWSSFNFWGSGVWHAVGSMKCCCDGTRTKFSLFLSGRVHTVCMGGGWGFKLLSKSAFGCAGGLDELCTTSLVAVLFEAASISPEGGEWSSWMLEERTLCRTVLPPWLKPGHSAEESRHLELRCQIYSCRFLQSPSPLTVSCVTESLCIKISPLFLIQ